VNWYLDRRGEEGKQGILVLAQGSGCASVTTSQNIERAKSLEPHFAVVTVDKYGVEPGDRGEADGGHCSKAFYGHGTVSQRVADYQRVISQVEQMPWWNGQIVMFGGSEGGAVLQLLASRVRFDGAVVFSSATGETFDRAMLSVLPPEVKKEAAAKLAAARANPTSTEVWGGNSFAWYADVIDREFWRDASASDVPILAIQGARDRSNSVDSARAFRAAFVAQHRCHLTYWEYPDYDHAMVDPQGSSHLDEVLHRTSEWLDARLKHRPMDGCVDR
jgi:alpha-beta hydrolase superfamily lysophospholipase